MNDLFPKEHFESWLKAVEKSRKIVLGTHVNPDGDAIGALMGLGLFLKKEGFEVTLVSPTRYPEFLSFLDPGHEIVVYSQDSQTAVQAIKEADMIVALDVSGFSRMDALGKIMLNSKAFKVLIDHHTDPVNKEFDLVFSTTRISSTCELTYRVIKSWKADAVLSKEQADAFLAGIITDTNQFANSVYPGTFRITSELVAFGADTEFIYDQVYRNFSYNRMRLMGYALQNIRLLPEYKCGYIVLPLDVLAKFGYSNGDTEGFVNLPLAISGISVSAFFLQRADHIKVSLRSKGDIPVNGIARKFYQGGGHLNASAGKMEDSMEEIEPLLKKALGTIIA
ncbi:MAG: bifunctional oligoribonuclease/PAP phosphatase NrnA [Candidatus Methanomethylophilaceae archaeon]|jgi:phosphoesterase RecJ-like protein